MIRKRDDMHHTFDKKYLPDCRRLQQICYDNGYHADPLSCYLIWDLLSRCKPENTWLPLPIDDNEIWAMIKSTVNASAK